MTDSPPRVERDSLGEVRVPAGAYWGAQTHRALDNFQISGQPFDRRFIRALGLVKAAAAEVNAGLGHLPKAVAGAIRSAALQVAAGDLDGQFPVDVFQTGSGTSSNMNANEVIASLASRGQKKAVHANDQVNMGQSSNDVVPTAIQVAAGRLGEAEDLIDRAEKLGGVTATSLNLRAARLMTIAYNATDRTSQTQLWQQAGQLLDEAIKLDRTFALAYFNRALLEEDRNNGDTATSIEWWQQYVNLEQDEAMRAVVEQFRGIVPERTGGNSEL